MKIRSIPFILSLSAAALSAQKDSDVAPFDPSKVTPEVVPLDLIKVPDGLEVTIWASSPMLFNPTNMDIDRDGRIWVAEGVRYRRHWNRQPEGDRIVVLEDTDKDGKADSSHTFVQEEALVAPLGVAVIDNKIVVSQPPELIVYTDVNRNLVFEPGIDTRETLLEGFSGKNHDHSLHSVTVGPNGKWYFNSGNTGALFTDRSGKTFRIASPYDPSVIGPWEFPFNVKDVAGKKSDDGHVYVGGFTARMNPDGTNVEIIGHNYRNSYEQSITSFGDVFQNDNDDPPACRVTHVLEYGNAGFASADGQRAWRADQRPGQPTAIAEWRQEDPGTMPAGDVYGGGSPTGNVFYENGALGEKWQGMFLACEAGRNTVFGYFPKLDGAGFKLERFNFITTNQEGEFAGSDFIGGSNNISSDVKTLFRPSDVAIGPDGAIYVCDWYDGRVGGHQDLDETCSGTIYRIAPKGFKPNPPKINLSTTAGQIEALMSPAVNVRNLGYEALKAQGEKAIPAIKKLLDHKNPYIAARAIFLLAQMEKAGAEIVEDLLNAKDEQTRIAAYRALRDDKARLLPMAEKMAKDSSPAVRREVALSMRNVSAKESRPILREIAKLYPGNDRTYLEAFGIGSTGKEAQIYRAAKAAIGSDNPLKWTNAFADIAWRLHPASAVGDLAIRATSAKLNYAQKKQAMDALAFTNDKQSAVAMMVLAQGGDALSAEATWWLLNKANGDWENLNLLPELAERGIYDPSKIELQEIVSVDSSLIPNNYPPMDQLLKLNGNAARGKVTAQRCVMCHQVGDVGANFGPVLNGWGKTQTREVIFRSIIEPNADIAHGYTGYEIQLNDGRKIDGLLLKSTEPYIIMSMGGVQQIVPGDQVKRVRKLSHSLMMSGGQLGLTAQDVADVVAYLKSN
ncbi:MAG: c-type cytochrome [Verrucomicrobiae bacterium]|nr:c-type cytochrome [Verrucomicrobiae bacterium]